MRLENLYPNFGTATPEAQAQFMSWFRLKRASELATPPKETKKRSVIASKIDLSDEEKMMMKLLGLKQKDIAALRMQDEAEEDKASDVELFKDPAFEGGDDE